MSERSSQSSQPNVVQQIISRAGELFSFIRNSELDSVVNELWSEWHKLLAIAGAEDDIFLETFEEEGLHQIFMRFEYEGFDSYLRILEFNYGEIEGTVYFAEQDFRIFANSSKRPMVFSSGLYFNPHKPVLADEPLPSSRRPMSVAATARLLSRIRQSTPFDASSPEYDQAAINQVICRQSVGALCFKGLHGSDTLLPRLERDNY